MFGRKKWFGDSEPHQLLGKSRLKVNYCSTYRIHLKKKKLLQFGIGFGGRTDLGLGSGAGQH